MQLAIKVKGLSLAQEARIIRKLENARRQSAKWAREKQKAIELARTGNFPHYEAKSIGFLVARPNAPECIARYHARIAAKNHLTDIARKIGIRDPAPYRLGEIEANLEVFSLHEHRIHSVRPEARCAHLAYGFLRGRPYVVMENKSYDWPNWERIEQLITKYGDGDPRVLLQRFSEWKQEGQKRGLIHEPTPPTAKTHGIRTPEPLQATTPKTNGVLGAVKEFLGIAS